MTIEGFRFVVQSRQAAHRACGLFANRDSSPTVGGTHPGRGFLYHHGVLANGRIAVQPQRRPVLVTAARLEEVQPQPAAPESLRGEEVVGLATLRVVDQFDETRGRLGTNRSVDF